MSTVVRTSVLVAAGLFALSACSSGPLRSIKAGDEVARYDFSEPATFEEGAYPDASMRVDEGVYRITLNKGDNEVWWAQWGNTLSDVVVDVKTEQLSEPNENAYGVACRLRGHVGQEIAIDPTLAAIATGMPAAEVTAEATSEATAEATEEATSEATAEATSEATAEATAEVTQEATAETTAEASLSAATPVSEQVAEEQAANGDGYLFLIQGSGSYGIFRARGRSLTPLVNWTPSALIHQGAAKNELRAVCMGTYLALYINESFAADTTDDSYSDGQVGLAASSANRLGVEVQFDDLVVSRPVSG